MLMTLSSSTKRLRLLMGRAVSFASSNGGGMSRRPTTTCRCRPISTCRSSVSMLDYSRGILVRRNMSSSPSSSADGKEEFRERLSMYDESDNWEDWFSPDEYENAWEGLEDLDYLPLDNATRFLVQLLQDLYHGIPVGLDRPCTSRCNAAIKNLSDYSQGGKKLKGRAQRADAILRRMELFWELQPPRDSKLLLPFQLPHPNRDTYFGVLKLYATTSSEGREIPDRCREIVERMQQRYQEFGQLDVKPDVVIWNQVLSAWAICKDDQKAFEAANILQQLKKENNMADSSSYGHVLRACAFSNTSERAKKLGSEIAIKVWKDFLQTNLESTSYMYTFYLQACQHIDNKKKRETEVEAAFHQCCQEGMVNAHVLHELKRAASPQLFRKLLGRAIIDVAKDPDGDAALVQRVPRDWTRNANVKTDWGW